MLTIEFDPPKHGHCDCCDGTTTTLTRFVSQNGDAYAIYYAAFSNNHPDRYVSVIISIGEWGEDTAPSRRDAFYMRIWTNEKHFQVGLGNADESPWKDAKILGKKLTRAEALAHPLISDVFHISDHIVAEDQPIIAYLNGKKS